MNEIYRQKEAELLIYTRHPDREQYPDGLARSIHFAWSKDGRTYQPLNRNYGILFAEAVIRKNNTICAKGLKNPWVFKMAAGYYGILAIRVNEDGSEDQESLGCVFLWTTEDFIEFKERGMLRLGGDIPVHRVSCQYLRTAGFYEVLWEDKEGGLYFNTTSDIISPSDLSAPQSASKRGEVLEIQGPEGAVPGNCIKIKSDFCDRIVRRWKPVRNTEILVPDKVEVSSEEDLNNIYATAFYSDGSSVLKAVRWDHSGVDYKQPGEYTVNGTVADRRYPFPLARGFADPVVFQWKGTYYFISTNDNLDDVGLYVRQADTPEALFYESTEHQLILEYNEEYDFIQTFWAPEFHIIGGELYILFAVGGKRWSPQCHLMKLKKGGSILDKNSWEKPVRIQKRDGSWLAEKGITLDMTYLKVKGVSYMIWSYREHIGTDSDTGSMLYIATTDEKLPWKLTSDPVLLSRPRYGWENVEGTINNEGPYAFVTDDTVYVTYSGGAANGYTYALGLLKAKTGADLLKPESWNKSTAPVLSYYSLEHRYGPGHNSFFVDPEGNLMIAYHGVESIKDHIRCTGIHRVHFDITGNPVFSLSPERDLKPELRKVKTRAVVR